MDVNSEAELAEAVAGATGPLAIVGGGTQGFQTDGVEVSTRGLRGVTLYEPGALTLVAQAGTPVREIETLLASEGQQLAFEPRDHRGVLGREGTPTIGGVVAGNISGPRRVQAGACRDYLLGVRFVDGRGVVVKNGGRVMKNVTGYDLVKLMAGSYGTLGVISEVSLKVLPVAEASAVLRIEGLDDVKAVQALSAALGSPFDVTGAAHTPMGPDRVPVTMIRLEGFEASVTYRAQKLRTALSSFGEITIETDATQTKAQWRWVRDVQAFDGQSGDIWRLSVKPTDGPKIGAVLREQLGAKVLYDWGGGLVWALVPEGSDVRGLTAGIKGHATIVRASKDTLARFGRVPSEGVILDRLAKGLRAKFDPRGILNPGLMSVVERN